MTNGTDIPSLIERAEKLTGPDREFDCYLHGLAIGGRFHVVFADAAQSGRLAGEIDRQSPAAREVAALTDEIARLGIGRVGQ